VAQTTRTLNPLPFKDLEPHRFEDLVRQLAYDFRRWKKLEAIGRSGGDEGIDIRGIETLATEAPIATQDTDEVDGDSEAEDADSVLEEQVLDERVWIVQCKRENRLGPTKARKIIDEFFSASPSKIYGYILAAACDFSKATRDAIRDELLKHDVQEYHCWGKGELEDQLYQPKNDNLLFAYFGVSLQIRRRAMRTTFRSHLALKKKLIKYVGSLDGFTTNRCPLIRDPRNEQYPYVGEDVQAFMKTPAWRYYEFYGHEPPDHIAFVIRKRFAYVNWETEEFDVIRDVNIAIPHHLDVYGLAHRSRDHFDLEQRARVYWHNKVPEANRAYGILVGAISYDSILLCDELGDKFNPAPHLLVEYSGDDPFDLRWAWLESATDPNQQLVPKEDKQIEYFPTPLSDTRQDLAEKARNATAGTRSQTPIGE
jgi:hypothetical protein